MNGDAVEKVRKLMRLAESTTSEGEAQNAILQAQEIIAREGIDLGVLDGEAPKPTTETVLITATHRDWQAALISAVAGNFRCFAYRATGLSPEGKTRYVFNVVGLESDASVVREVVETVLRVVPKLARAYARKSAAYLPLTERQIRYAFLDGFVQGLSAQLKEQRDKWALVLAMPDPVREAKEAMRSNRGSLPAGRPDQKDAARQMAALDGYANGFMYDAQPRLEAAR